MMMYYYDGVLELITVLFDQLLQYLSVKYRHKSDCKKCKNES